MSMVRRGVETGGRRRKSRGALTSRPEIDRLLDAARAPAGPRELAGERAAVDLFARAHLVTSAPEVAVVKRASRTGFKAAAASVAAVVVMSSGVSFAATGHIPFAGTIKKVTGHGNDEGAAGGDPQGRATGDKTGDPTANGPKAVALHGLCRAYRHGQKVTHGHALDQRPFTALVTAAGGADQVDGFCAALPPLGQQDDSQTRPAHPTHPTTGPNGEPTDPGNSGGTHPAHPTKPTQANSPTQPTHPPKPTQGTEPTHKPKPTQGTDPTSKPKPTRNPHSSASA
jgi:hypothetical protein